ncbi:MAG: transposase [Oscillospiraceae bacterium]|nr:transposase [Oscillospiraceae bacterium]
MGKVNANKQKSSIHAGLRRDGSQNQILRTATNGRKNRILASKGECRLATYLREMLISALKKGDIVVMDNLRSHRVKEVEELLRQNEITLLYLPLYSPDLNPIEKMWSKMKSCLRRWKIRVKEALPAAVADALALVMQDDVMGWFRASYYCR